MPSQFSYSRDNLKSLRKCLFEERSSKSYTFPNYVKFFFERLNDVMTVNSGLLTLVDATNAQKDFFRKSIVFRKPEKMTEDYLKCSQFDVVSMSQQFIDYPEDVINFEKFESFEDHIETMLFKNYGSHYNIYQAISIAVPFSNSKGVICDLYRADRDLLFQQEEEEFFEDLFMSTLVYQSLTENGCCSKSSPQLSEYAIGKLKAQELKIDIRN